MSPDNALPSAKKAGIYVFGGGIDETVPPVLVSANATAMLWLASIDDLLAAAARRIQRDSPIFTEEERRRFLIEE